MPNNQGMTPVAAGLSPNAGSATHSWLSNASQFCSEMARKWLPDCCHPKRVTENLTLNSEVTFDRCNLLGGSRAGNAGRSQQDGGVLESAFCDFHDSIWVRHDEFDPTWIRHTPEAALPVKGATIGSVLTDLAVGEKRLTDVRKLDGLLVVKVIDRRILAVTGPRPDSQKDR